MSGDNRIISKESLFVDQVKGLRERAGSNGVVFGPQFKVPAGQTDQSLSAMY